MLLVSDKSAVAVRALVGLARAGGEREAVAIAEVARRADLSLTQLEQLFVQLKRGGLLRSQRGVGGGYLLTRSIGQISLLDVVEAVDGPLGADTDAIFNGPRDALRGALARRTLEEVVREEDAAGAPMYWI
ncbi:MAG: Rrf2 family transcriptional regulator [Solirubrobacteraceae bacterium]|nr:Rrf2 family transcriptional regulator [Solirubrobacteraceae bacterium]